MKVALVTGEFPPQQGGVGDYTRELAREFARRDINVSVITAPVPHPGSSVSAEPYAISPARFASWRSLADVDRLTRDCDLVHIQYQAAAYGMTPPIHFLPRYLRWRRARRRLLVTFHDLKVPYLFPKARALRWRAVLALARACDAVVVTNQEDRLTLHSAIGNRQSAIRYIPIGSNITAPDRSIDRHAVRASLGVAPDVILLCYFGFLNASKGGETLADVLANVVRAGYNARLLMLGGEVGASDPTNVAYAQRVRARMDQLGVRERVIWAGYRPAAEVSALWQASDIALLPYADGVSLRRGTLMAALAHGMPIVSTTPRVSVPELRDDENIALAPPHAADALAAQVIALIRSPALRERLAQGALRLALDFTWPRIADQHLELYQLLQR